VYDRLCQSFSEVGYYATLPPAYFPGLNHNGKGNNNSIILDFNQAYTRLPQCVLNGLLYRDSGQYYAMLNILP